MKKYALHFLCIFTVLISGCATETETNKNIEVAKSKSYKRNYNGVKSKIAIGKFENKTNYQTGLFSDGIDRLGMRSKSILISHLQQTKRFIILERANLDELKFESNLDNKTQKLTAAKYLITGNVTEFGRKEVYGYTFPISTEKTQIAYAKVILNVIDVDTSAVVYSASGAGESKLTNKEYLLIGKSSDYDSTLNDKVINLAVEEAVASLIEGIENNDWNPSE